MRRVPEEIMNKIQEAREGWFKYVRSSKEVDDWIEREFGVRLSYRYAGEDVKPFIEEVDGVETVYCVPVSCGEDFGELCILRDGRAVMVIDRISDEGSGLRREYVWLIR